MVTVDAGHNPGAPVLSVIARDAENKVAKFSPQNISNTLHGFAKLEWHPGNLMDTMADELLRKIDGFSPQVTVTPTDFKFAKNIWQLCQEFARKIWQLCQNSQDNVMRRFNHARRPWTDQRRPFPLLILS